MIMDVVLCFVALCIETSENFVFSFQESVVKLFIDVFIGVECIGTIVTQLTLSVLM